MNLSKALNLVALGVCAVVYPVALVLGVILVRWKHRKPQVERVLVPVEGQQCLKAWELRIPLKAITDSA
jgi:hypothetical protein